MYHNNKELGNDFENKLEDILATYSYWLYHTPNKNSGQPCDFILAKKLTKVKFFEKMKGGFIF